MTSCPAAALFAACVAGSFALSAPAPFTPDIHIEDVHLFYRVYDATGGHPTAEQLQTDYLDAGSEGLHTLARMRNVTGVRIAETLAKRPEMYVNARRCMAALPGVKTRVEKSLRKLHELYPPAKVMPITIALSRGKPVAIGSPASGVQVSLEALCDTEWLYPDVEDRFVYVIAHEFAHVQQVQALVDDEHPSVLEMSIIEGAAEFVGELISGKVSNPHMGAGTAGREKEIETRFVADQDKTDISDWLYNSTPTEPKDLGYWVGYRIVKAYYRHANDKKLALREILQMNDPKAFLAKSGWVPGIELK